MAMGKSNQYIGHNFSMSSPAADWRTHQHSSAGRAETVVKYNEQGTGLGAVRGAAGLLLEPKPGLLAWLPASVEISPLPLLPTLFVTLHIHPVSPLSYYVTAR